MPTDVRYRYDAIGSHPDHRRSPAERALRAGVKVVGRAVTRALLRAASRIEPSAPAAPAPRRAAPERAAERPRVRLPIAPAAAARRGAPRDVPRILLLNPPRYRGIPVTRIHRSEYLFAQGNQIPAMDLAYFAAAAADRAEVCIVEANAEDLDLAQVLARMEAFRPDVIVAKGVVNILEHDLAAPLAYKRRAPHVKVVLSCRGSIDAEAVVFSRFPLLDGIARGEVDAFARDIADRPDLAGIEGMALPDRPGGAVRVVEDLDAHPIPAFDRLPDAWYSGRRAGRRTGFSAAYYGIPSGYYLTSSRGCPYRCSFCLVGGIEGRPFRYRKRDPENVIEEMRALSARGIRDYYVFDEIFTMPGHGDRIAERIAQAGLDVAFVCEGKPDLVEPAMLRAMKRAGCIAVYYGLESGDDAILREVEKGHTTADGRRAIELTRAAGIPAGAYAMIGFPGETWSSVVRTAGMLLELRPDLVRYDFLMPYPVTAMHRQMREERLIASGDWSELDRRISPHHEGKVAIRSRALGPRTLKALDLLFKLAFSTELSRSPVAPHAMA